MSDSIGVLLQAPDFLSETALLSPLTIRQPVMSIAHGGLELDCEDRLGLLAGAEKGKEEFQHLCGIGTRPPPAPHSTISAVINLPDSDNRGEGIERSPIHLGEGCHEKEVAIGVAGFVEAKTALSVEETGSPRDIFSIHCAPVYY